MDSNVKQAREKVFIKADEWGNADENDGVACAATWKAFVESVDALIEAAKKECE